jgi:hypothetical protein
MFKNVCPNRVNLNFLSFKQYRGTEFTNRACYQALVLLQKKIETIFDIREIHGAMHVKLHKYPTMPIVKTLGLKVKATDSKGTSVVDFLEPVRPFFMRVSLRDELGKKICSRGNTKTWSTAHTDDEQHKGDHHQMHGLTADEKTLLELLSEPKAVIEDLLTNKYGAHDRAYHDYSETAHQGPYYANPKFGMNDGNDQVYDVNRKLKDDG